MLRREPHAYASAERQAGDMCPWYSRRLHESGNIVGEMLRRIGTFCFVRLSRSPEIERDAGKVRGVFCHLEGITGVVGGQVWDQNQRLARSLPVVVESDAIGFHLGHESLSCNRKRLDRSRVEHPISKPCIRAEVSLLYDQHSSSLPRPVLHPRSKGVPDRSLANWRAELLHKNEKSSCPKCRSMNSAR